MNILIIVVKFNLRNTLLLLNTIPSITLDVIVTSQVQILVGCRGKSSQVCMREFYTHIHLNQTKV